jgi:hypothetical protein
MSYLKLMKRQVLYKHSHKTKPAYKYCKLTNNQRIKENCVGGGRELRMVSYSHHKTWLCNLSLHNSSNESIFSFIHIISSFCSLKVINIIALHLFHILIILFAITHMIEVNQKCDGLLQECQNHLPSELKPLLKKN